VVHPESEMTVSPYHNAKALVGFMRFSSRHLRLFVPRKGTELETVQAAIEKEWRDREDVEDKPEAETGKCTEREGGSEEVEAQEPHTRDIDDSRACNEDVA
jgi:hypothetical protein